MPDLGDASNGGCHIMLLIFSMQLASGCWVGGGEGRWERAGGAELEGGRRRGRQASRRGGTRPLTVLSNALRLGMQRSMGSHPMRVDNVMYLDKLN